MGVKGNDRAEILAGSATISDGQQMDRTDILNALREAFRRFSARQISIYV